MVLRSLVAHALLFFSTAHAIPADIAAAAGSPSVTLASGVVVGTTTKLPSATAAISKYVGIPFAASPPQRFGPPKAPASWTKPLLATTTQPACVQQFSLPGAAREREMRLFNNPGLPPPAESEDCMYLNVYVPQGTTTKSKKPVLFWLFGGNLQFGTGGLGFYDGSSFAYNQDVVVVTPNYRTNVFGFPGSTEIRSPNQNPGFLDQRFALAWVQKNIAEFGGDPAKVTIFGESAGGYSVKQLLATPPKPLPFRAAIMESQAALNSGNATESFQQLAISLGCIVPGKQLACVRTKKATQIKSIIEKQGLSFFPTADGVTRVSDIRPAYKAGTAAQVPFMIGSNHDEGNVFAYILGLEDNPVPAGALDAVLATYLPGAPLLQQSLKNAFKGNSAYNLASNVITLLEFQCTAKLYANLGRDSGLDVYRYQFNASFPNLRSFPKPGAYHTSEIPEVFGNLPGTNQYGSNTPQQEKSSKYMQTTWANFAKDPTGKGPGLGWPLLGKGEMVRELRRSGEASTIEAKSIDQKCVLFQALIEAQGL